MSVIEQYGAPPIGVSATTWRMYSQGVPSAAQAADAAQNAPAYPLLQFMSLIGDQMGQIEDLLNDLTYISPANGGPPAGSGDLYSYSTLVDPWLANPTWLPWLAMVTGTNITGMNQLQARLAIAAQQSYGRTQGSKVAIQEAIRSLFVFSVPTATATANSDLLNMPLPNGLNLPVATGNLLNPGESSYVVDDPTWQNWVPISGVANDEIVAPSQIAYLGDYSLSVSQTGTSSDQLGIMLNRQIPVMSNQAYAISFYSMPNPNNAASASCYSYITFFDATGNELGNTDTLNANLSQGNWTQCTGTFTTPAGTATISVDINWGFSARLTTSGVYVDLITLTGLNPYGALMGALLFGQGVPSGTSISDLITLPEVIMSVPTPSGISNGVAVVPNIPIAVLDHYNNNPWSIAVLVPVGVPLSAAYHAALTQKPAGYGLTILYTYADWSTLYATFGSGTSISWSEISGLSWQTWEQTT